MTSNSLIIRSTIKKKKKRRERERAHLIPKWSWKQIMISGLKGLSHLQEVEDVYNQLMGTVNAH